MAWLMVALCIGLASFCAVKGVSEPVLFIGTVGFLLAAVWYFGCIRWVDANGKWGA